MVSRSRYSVVSQLITVLSAESVLAECLNCNGQRAVLFYLHYSYFIRSSSRVEYEWFPKWEMRRGRSSLGMVFASSLWTARTVIF